MTVDSPLVGSPAAAAPRANRKSCALKAWPARSKFRVHDAGIAATVGVSNELSPGRAQHHTVDWSNVLLLDGEQPSHSFTDCDDHTRSFHRPFRCSGHSRRLCCFLSSKLYFHKETQGTSGLSNLPAERLEPTDSPAVSPWCLEAMRDVSRLVERSRSWLGDFFQPWKAPPRRRTVASNGSALEWRHQGPRPAPGGTLKTAITAVRIHAASVAPRVRRTTNA